MTTKTPAPAPSDNTGLILALLALGLIASYFLIENQTVIPDDEPLAVPPTNDAVSSSVYDPATGSYAEQYSYDDTPINLPAYVPSDTTNPTITNSVTSPVTSLPSNVAPVAVLSNPLIIAGGAVGGGKIFGITGHPMVAK